MRFEIQKFLAVLSIMTPTWAAFQNFVIENEKDLQRFGVSNDETLYYEMLNDDTSDDESYNAVDSNYADFRGSHNIFKRSGGNDIDAVGGSAFDGSRDEDILKEIIRQLVDDPSFYQMKKHFRKDELLLNQDYGDYYMENVDSCMYHE